MKKLLTSLIVIAFAVLLLGPLAVGFLAKQEMEGQVADLNRSKFYRVDQLDYQRGWLESSSKFQITSLKNPSNILVLNSKADHGPIMFNRGGKLGLMAIEASFKLQDLLNMIAPSLILESESVLGYQGIFTLSGGKNFFLQVDKASIRFFDPLTLSKSSEYTIRNLDFQGSLFSVGSRFEIEGEIESIDVATSGKVTNILNTQLNGEFEALEPKGFSSSGKLKISRVKETTQLNGQVESGELLNDLLLNFFIKPDGEETVELRVDNKISEILLEQAEFESVSLLARFEHLNLSALGEFYRLLPPPSERQPGKGILEGNYWQQEEINAAYRNSLKDWLKKSPALEIKNFGFFESGEKIVSNGAIRFGYSPKWPAINFEDPKTFNPYLTVDLQVEATDGLAREIAAEWLTSKMAQSRMGESLSMQTIRQMSKGQAGTFLVLQEQLGNVTKTADGYFSHFKISEGKKYLNNQPILRK